LKHENPKALNKSLEIKKGILMRNRLFILLIYIMVFVCLSLTGCRDLETETEKITAYKENYEVVDGKTAALFNYDYKNRSMYIAGLKLFEKFGTSNEGSVSILTDENALAFRLTKATGSVSGTVDGPFVYFKMDLATNEIIEKRFEPAPDYAELGMTEFIEHSEEVIELTDERMVEIGAYFKELLWK